MNQLSPLWLLGLWSLCVASGAFAQSDLQAQLNQQLSTLWGEELGAVPATPGLLLLEMAKDTARAERVLSRASSAQCALTDSLLRTIELSEAQALRLLPELYVVRDDSPGAAHRPPSWPALRAQGVSLLERIALDPTNGRDLRLARALAERRERISRWTPSEIAGLVVLCSQWWIERGETPKFYLRPDLLPDPSPALAALPGELTLWKLLPRLHDQALWRRLLLDRLSMSEHAFLVAECMEILGSYGPDFLARGLPIRQWDPVDGRMVGYDEVDLRAVALEILPRVSPLIPSGVDEHAQIRDAFLWWRRARYQARYYRDPTDSVPVLPEILARQKSPAEGGLPMSEWLKQLYAHDELRDLVLDEMGPAQSVLVAELMEWLSFSLEQAREHGFNFAERRFPLRPDPASKGIVYSVPWASVQILIRELLERISGHTLVAAAELDAAEADAQWRLWWSRVSSDPRWYRDPSKVESKPPRFAPERSRADN